MRKSKNYRKVFFAMNDRAVKRILTGTALIFLSLIIVYISLDLPRTPGAHTEGTAGLSQERTQLVSETFPAPDARGAETQPPLSGEASEMVNLNTAGVEELMKIPGIGETRARAILEYREINGMFLSTEEVMQVKGIGEGVYSKMLPFITV